MSENIEINQFEKLFGMFLNPITPKSMQSILFSRKTDLQKIQESTSVIFAIYSILKSSTKNSESGILMFKDPL